MNTQPVKTAVHLCLLALFILVVYLPVLDAPFVFDDIPNIVQNTAVQAGSLREIPQAIFSEVSGTRPLAMFTFAVNYYFDMLNPYGYRAVNTLIHVVNAVVLYFIVILFFRVPGSRLQKSLNPETIQIIAFWSVLIWAMNPVQHQAVTYIVQRMTSLATLFYLLSIYTYLRYRCGDLGIKVMVFLAGSCFVLGMASKEIMITMPVSLLLLDYFLLDGDRVKLKKWFLPVTVFVIVISYFYIEGIVQGLFIEYPGRGFSPYERMLTEPRVLFFYLSLLFMPLPARLNLEYNITVSTSLLEPVTTILSIIGIFMLLGFAWYYRKRTPLITYAFLFFFLASSVEASFLNLEIAYLHRLYLPSVFIFPALLMYLPVWHARHNSILFLVIVSLLAYGTQTRNADWQSRASLWQADYSENPRARRSLVNGAIALIEQSRYDEAINLLAPEIDSFSSVAADNARYTLGLAYFHNHEFLNATRHFREIDQSFKEYGLVLFYMALAYQEMDNNVVYQGIMSELNNRFADKPYSVLLDAELSRKNGDFSAAVDKLQYIIVPDHELTIVDENLIRAYLANVYLDMKNYTGAYAQYLKIIDSDPAAYFAWQQIHAMQVSAGDMENANTIRVMLESKGIRIDDENR